LQSILQTLPQEAQLPVDLGLSLITLQQRAVTGTGVAGTAGPQLQILDPAIFGADYSVAEALAALQQFKASVEAQRSGLDSDVQHIDEAIAATLAASAGEEYKLARLAQDESVAKDQYLALSSQAEEMKKLQDGLRIARVIGQAVPPPRSTSHQVLRNLVVGGFLALVLTALAVIAVDWWKQAPLE
jgi:uncharacterized protein involved in exopolysaccharide biosynthesis